MKPLPLCRLHTIFTLFFITISTVLGQEVNDCYTVYKEADNVWRIVERNTVNIYLVEGKDSALVIDAGYGSGDLKTYLQTLTKLPLLVVNTHGHGDHIGSDYQFSKIYIHPKDYELYHASVNNKTSSPTLIPVKEGYVFDLGGTKLEVMEVPGHTSGSICLLDKKDKMLFAGDHINAVVWLFLDSCLPLEIYLSNLVKVENHLDEFDTIMPGHNEPLDKTYLRELITCVKSILDGTCQSEPYDYSSISAGALMCKYKRSLVAYDPDKLYKEKQ